MRFSFAEHTRFTLLAALALSAMACDEGDDAQHEIAAIDRPDDAQLDAAVDAATRAEAVFTGQVTHVSHRLSEPDADGLRLPFTHVTWRVDDAIKGVRPGQPYTARFLGGPMGDAWLEVDEIPQFEVGDQDMVFVIGNGEHGCPLVGGAEGRIQIERASGHGDGVSRRAPDHRWVEDLAIHLHEAGVGDDAPLSVPDLDRPFVFAVPQHASAEQRRAAAERARSHLARPRPVSAGDEAERRAFAANASNPVLGR